MTLDEAIKVLRQHNVTGLSVLRITRGQASEKELLSQVLDSCEQLISERAEYKRLLKMTVEDISKMPCNNDTHSPDSCYICVKHGNCSYADSFKWCRADMALKLIGETNEP